MKITTSVVLYKHSKEMLTTFLASYEKAIRFCNASNKISFLLYIVNNDISREINYKTDCIHDFNIEFKYIESDKNGGYGYGNNSILFQLDSSYHLIVNPDIVFFEDAYAKSIRALEDRQDFGLLTPSVYDQKKELQFSCRKNPTLFSQFLRFTFKHEKKYFSSYLKRYEYQDHSYDEEIYDIPNCTGCFMFFRTDILKKINGFDEIFFYYMDDCDLSRRSLEVSRTIYSPSVKVVHEYQGDAYKNKKLRNIAIKSAFKYWWKWGGIF